MKSQCKQISDFSTLVHRLANSSPENKGMIRALRKSPDVFLDQYFPLVKEEPGACQAAKALHLLLNQLPRNATAADYRKLLLALEKTALQVSALMLQNPALARGVIAVVQELAQTRPSSHKASPSAHSKKPLLMIPGPTPLPPQVLSAMAKPVINPYGPEFKPLLSDIEEGLKKVLGTREPVAIFSASGTGGMEAALVNLISPGDKVLACPNDTFGEEFIKMARGFGADVEVLPAPPGKGVDPEALKNRLGQDTRHEIKAILLTHIDTSTGVENDLAALSKARQDHPALLVVDSVSASGAVPVNMDALKLDAVIGASQKALMAPPGIAFLALSKRAQEMAKKGGVPRYYFDVTPYLEHQEKGESPFTPALPVLYGLQASLKLIQKKGLPEVFRQHEKLAAAVEKGVEAMGLKIYAEPGHRAATVTAVLLPPGIQGNVLRDHLSKRYGVIVSGGFGELKEKIIRIAHMGFAGKKEILQTLYALGEALSDLGFSARTKAAIKTAESALK